MKVTIELDLNAPTFEYDGQLRSFMRDLGECLESLEGESLDLIPTHLQDVLGRQVGHIRYGWNHDHDLKRIARLIDKVSDGLGCPSGQIAWSALESFAKHTLTKGKDA